MLHAERALRKKFCAEAAAGDIKVVDALDNERTVGYFVPGLAVVNGSEIALEMKGFAVDVNGIVRLAEHIVELNAAEKVGCGKHVFGFDIAAFADAYHRSNFCKICVFEALEILLIELKLTDYTLLTLNLSLGEVLGIGAVYVIEKFGVVEGDRVISARNHKALPIVLIIVDKVAVCDSFVKISAKVQWLPAHTAT